jgi:hypothetical protein
MVDEVPVDLLGVDRAAGLGEIEDRPFRNEPEGQPDIAELQVEIDDRHLVAVLREADCEVAGCQRLARAPLGSEHADHRRQRDPRRDR